MTSGNNQVVVVTGGASGIGAACVRTLSACGWKVVVADLNLEQAQAVAAECDAVAYRMDVGDEADVQAVAQRIEQEVGPVMGLVNSAGIIQRPQPPGELPMDTWDRIQQIDYRGTWVACVAFGRAMVQRGRGSIVTISSITASASTPLHAYGPAKAAVVGITRNLAAEWGPSGVRVNAVAPGFVLTPVLQQAVDRGERNVSLLAGNAALQRTVEPSEVASVAEFLISDRASAITGIELTVDCGWQVGKSWNSYGGLPNT